MTVYQLFFDLQSTVPRTVFLFFARRIKRMA